MIKSVCLCPWFIARSRLLIDFEQLDLLGGSRGFYRGGGGGGGVQAHLSKNYVNVLSYCLFEVKLPKCYQDGS